ncbi:MAG: hypothetical protein IJ802_03200, partial [Kiritimatiellae bacterium]|nr:hypothetical protein [Kiritimatiellia bacterium]
ATPTWHGMLLPDNTVVASAEEMQKAWGKVPLSNRCPAIEPIKCSNTVLSHEGEVVTASVSAYDPDGDALSYKWILLSDTGDYDTIGLGLAMPDGWDDAIVSGQGTDRVAVKLPGGGTYRLYAYVFDGKGRGAYANVPITSPGAQPKRILKPTALPFAVYGESPGPWVPSGYMGNTRALKVDTSCTENPFSGETCIKIDYLDHIGWAGIFWQDPANDWGEKAGGRNLSNAATLVFRARGAHGGEKVTFFMGGLKDKPFSDTASAKLENVILKKEWTRYRIPLDGLDLSTIKTGFGFTIANDGDPFTFYLDDITYVAE